MYLICIEQLQFVCIYNYVILLVIIRNIKYQLDADYIYIYIYIYIYMLSPENGE